MPIIDSQVHIWAENTPERPWAPHMEGRAQLGWELWGLMVLMAWHRARTQDRQQLAAMSPVLRQVSVP